MARPNNRFRTMMRTAREEQAESNGATTTRGRPIKGKSSNPDYESTTIYLRKDVKHRALRILFEKKDRGLSDIFDEFLEEWVDKNS